MTDTTRWILSIGIVVGALGSTISLILNGQYNEAAFWAGGICFGIIAESYMGE